MFGILSLVTFELFGAVAAQRLFARRCALTRIWLGLVLGLIEMMWFPSLFAFAVGFTLPAQQYALALAGLIAVACALWKRKPRGEAAQLGKTPPPCILFVVVISVAALAGYLQYTHTLRNVGGALYVGQSTYGDLSMHLSFATGLIGQSYPPEYTLLPGALLGYPFLVDALSATMMLFGASLTASFIVPGTLMTALIAWGFVTLAWELSGKKLAVITACLLLFLNGGLGFMYVLDKLGADQTALKNALNEFYMTPTNMPDYNLRWVNALCDLILPQRALMVGWMCVLPALYLLADGIRTRDTRTFAGLGLLGGVMPMIHTHSFLALGLISFGALIGCAIKDRRYIARFLLYGALAVIIALPQLLVWTFPQTFAGGALRFHFNWINNSEGLTDGYLWFWIKNIGPVFILFIPAALNARESVKPLTLGALVLFVVAELVLFQPNSYDNNKLFFVAFLLMLPVAADFIAACLEKMRGVRGRYLLYAAFMVVCTLSGSITIARECVSSYQLFSVSETQAAEYVKKNAPADAVFLTSTQHNNPIPSLTGRGIVCGSSHYLFYHGLDYSKQYTDHVLMLAFPGKYEDLYDKYGVDYIYASSYEHAVMSADWQYIEDEADRQDHYWIDMEYITQNFPLVFECGEWYDHVQIYAVSERARYAALNTE